MGKAADFDKEKANVKSMISVASTRWYVVVSYNLMSALLHKHN